MSYELGRDPGLRRCTWGWGSARIREFENPGVLFSIAYCQRSTCRPRRLIYSSTQRGNFDVFGLSALSQEKTGISALHPPYVCSPNLPIPHVIPLTKTSVKHTTTFCHIKKHRTGIDPPLLLKIRAPPLAPPGSTPHPPRPTVQLHGLSPDSRLGTAVVACCSRCAAAAYTCAQSPPNRSARMVHPPPPALSPACSTRAVVQSA